MHFFRRVVIGQCVPLSASTGHETGTDAVGTALTDDWEIDVIARSNERRRDFSTVDDARSIVLIYSRRESHLAFVYLCIRAFVYSFIHSFEPSTFSIMAVDSDSEEPGTPTKAIGEEASLRTSEEGSNNGDDGSTKRRAAFHLAFGRGLLDESRAASMTRRGAVGVADSTHQRSLEDALNQLAQVFRECKREKANDELVEMAMKELEKMHAKMPEYLRIPARSTLQRRLAEQARNLADRVVERQEMAKNLPEGIVRGIESVLKSFDESDSPMMKTIEGMNTVASLGALKQRLDRVRGTSKTGITTFEDKATHCKNLANNLIKISENDTKVIMHSQYIGAQMHLLDPNANDELTRMTHNPKCSDAGYLWRAIRAFSEALFEQKSVSSFIQRALPHSLRKEARDSLTARIQKEGAHEYLVCRVQLIPALVICAYASMDNLNVQRVHSLFKQSAQEALPDSASFLELQGFVHTSPEIDVVKRATIDQFKRLRNEGIEFNSGITIEEASAIEKGVNERKRVSKGNDASKADDQPQGTVFSRLGEAGVRRTASETLKPTKPKVTKPSTSVRKSPPQTTKKATIKIEQPFSRRCEICEQDVKGVDEKQLENNWKMHLKSKAHAKSLLGPEPDPNAPPRDAALESFSAADQAYAVMIEVPPPPSAPALKTVKVPPPPQKFGTGTSQHQKSNTLSDHKQNFIKKRLQEVDSAQKHGKRRRLDEYIDKPEPRPYKRVLYCKYFERGKCWNGDECKFRHGRMPDSPCDSFG